MKKLLYIIIILPLFGFGQLVSSGGALLSNPYSYPVDNCVQALTTATATTLVDAIGVRDGDVQPSMAYEFNGTNNYIDSGVKVEGQTPIDFECTFLTNDITNDQGIFSCGGYPDLDKGIVLRINKTTGALFIIIADGSGYHTKFTGVCVNINTLYTLSFSWNGIANNDITIILNGTSHIFNIPRDWTGDSTQLLIIGEQNSIGFYFNGKIFDYSYTINNNPKVEYNCEEASGTTSYSKTIGTIGTINGTIAGFHIPYFVEGNISVANNQGYGTNDADPTIIIPISTDGINPVIACDNVYLGQVKYNVDISTGDYIYPLAYDLLILDTDSTYFDFTTPTEPTAKELSITDLPQNWNDQYFWNTDNSTYAKQGLIYSVPVPTNPIDKYYDGKRYLIKF